MLRSMNLNIPNAFRRGLLIGGAIFTLAISSGCAALFVGGVAAGAGAGAVYYTRGELSSVQSAALDRTFQATHDAMQDLKFTETSSRVDAVEASELHFQPVPSHSNIIRVDLDTDCFSI